MSLNPSLTGNVAICVPARLWQVFFPHRALCHNYSSQSWLYGAALRQPLVKTPYTICLHGTRGNPSDPLTSALIDFTCTGTAQLYYSIVFWQKFFPIKHNDPQFILRVFTKKGFKLIIQFTVLVTWMCVILSSLISQQSCFTAFLYKWIVAIVWLCGDDILTLLT